MRDVLSTNQPSPVQTPAPDAAQNTLLNATDALCAAIESAETELESSYSSLANKPLISTPDPDLDAEIQTQIATLKQVNDRLKQAHQRTMSMEDELSARYSDMQKSCNRKWYLPNPPSNGTIDLEEQQQDHFARGVNLYKILLVCFIGSFAGVVVESIWCLLRHGYLESRAGLVYGPFNLLYGVGAAALTLALYRFRNRGPWLSFLGSMLVGSVVEYLCSWGQEALFGSRSWDYSAMPFNLNGRICLLYACFWGVLGVLWIKDVYPRMAKLILKLPNKFGKIATWCVTIFLILNAAMSLLSVQRWSERIHDIPPSNRFWQFIDQRFPDERMELVYANMEFGNPDDHNP